MNALRTKKKAIIVAAVLVAAAILLGVGMMAVSKNNKKDLQYWLDLGTQYLEETDYERAIAAYQEALEIDPYNVDAYLGIVDAYMQLEDYEKALEYAEKGYEMTKDDGLAALIELLKTEIESRKGEQAQADNEAAAESAAVLEEEAEESSEPSETPETSEAPESPTPEPENTASPEPTARPENFSAAARTAAPASEPEVTQEPEAEPEPEPEPEVTPEPEPEVTPEPEPEVTPEPIVTPEPVTGSISGRVMEASDRDEPVSTASISVYVDEVLYTEISPDDAGNYTLSLPIGDYQIVVTAENYLPLNTYVTVTEDNAYVETFYMIKGSQESSGAASGNVYNALTGSGIGAVNLTVRNGWNNTVTGEVVTSIVTDENGGYSLELPFGNYTIYAEKEGYISILINIVVQEGTTASQNGTMTPIVSGNNFRIVLAWGENPRDLDSHVMGTLSSGDQFHVYYRYKNQYDGDIEICNLDVDDTSSYGPETITLNTTVNAPYYYYIYHFSGSGSIATSDASVTVYQGDSLVAAFNAPTDQGDGRTWNVFAIVDGNLVIQNTITDSADVGYASGGDAAPLSLEEPLEDKELQENEQ